MVKNLPASADVGSIPGPGRSPGEENVCLVFSSAIYCAFPWNYFGVFGDNQLSLPLCPWAHSCPSTDTSVFTATLRQPGTRGLGPFVAKLAPGQTSPGAVRCKETIRD